MASTATAADVAVLDDVRRFCESLEPALLKPDDVGRVFESLAAMRKLVDGALTRITPRYERSGIWKDKGARSATDAVAAATGQTPADSKRRLDAGKGAEKLGVLDEALRGGLVSGEQAGVIAGAAGRDETAGVRLVEIAKTGSHRELRDEAARERARLDSDEAERLARHRRARRVSRWTDEDGMYNLHLRTMPEVGAQIDARLKPLVDHEFDAARKQGRREPVPAYVADAVCRVLTEVPEVASENATCTGRSATRRPNDAVRPERKVIALVDINALNRGHATAGETCELAGVGPVSVAAVRAMLGDAATAVAFRDAVDIRSVVHFGRQVTAAQRTALEARGPRCGIVGCRSTHQLELDHTIGFTFTRTTEVDDLEWLCSTDHALKTQRNLLAIGPPGARVLVVRDPNDPTRPKQPLEQVRPAARVANVPSG